MMTVGIIGLGKLGNAIYNAIKDRFDTIGTDGEHNIGVAKTSDIVILAVKPNIIPDVANEIAAHIRDATIIVSVAAGVTIGRLENLFDAKKTIVRAMPNTPLLVGEGMTAICANKNAKKRQINHVTRIFKYMGKCEIIGEEQMDIITAISGSSPAYTYMYIEAMINAAVKLGMPPHTAALFAGQAVLGSAKMVLESGRPPELLINDVCSPGGTTIEAVKVLEQTHFADCVKQAVNAAYEKSIKIGKQADI